MILVVEKIENNAAYPSQNWQTQPLSTDTKANSYRSVIGSQMANHIVVVLSQKPGLQVTHGKQTKKKCDPNNLFN